MEKCGYLIKDYTEWSERQKPKLDFAYSEKELMEIIDDAKNNNRKVSIFEVGDCLLDWS